MPDPVESTRVLFPGGSSIGTSQVVRVLDTSAGTGIITTESPFHPIDHTWPDQPGDIGTLTLGDHTVAVVDCVTGASRLGNDEVAIGSDIPARRGDDEWAWYVVHLIDEPYENCAGWVGAPATLCVDAERRASLSASHTACHLMAFALNDVLAPRWRKDVQLDSLGHPNFDAIAITSSVIGIDRSTDTYRLGKSLRKKGFTVAATDEMASLADSIEGLGATVESLLNDWAATDAPVRIETSDEKLTSPRTWSCQLPQGVATVPCGGTHVERLSALGRLHVTARLSDDQTELTITTRPG